MNWQAMASALSLAMDAFAVSVSVRGSWRLGLTCGLFQFFMPLLGGLLGRGGGVFQRWVPVVDHWLAFGLLALVGGNMILGAVRDKKDNKTDKPEAKAPVSNPEQSLKVLLSLGLATSIDALVVGLSFALVGLPVIELAVDAGLVTALLCLLGGQIGRFAGARLGPRVEVLGGILLILIGLNILVTHILEAI